MSRGPSIAEITAFLADVKTHRTRGGDPAALAERKAELLERIAASWPDDTDAAETARLARADADRNHGR